MRENEDGADFLPMRLVTVLVVASLVLVSAAVYAMEAVRQSSKEAARSCMSTIIAVAETEYTESSPGLGDGAIVDVLVPANVCNMTFGATGADEDSQIECSTACSILYADGTEERYLAGMPLCPGSPGTGKGGPLVLCPGRYSISISTGEINGRPVVMIYAEGK
ncbi:MAG TPA: hypothetical protein VGJ92_10605 [Methanocella sp.]|jgi:Tfp pilus assembly protein PilE